MSTENLPSEFRALPYDKTQNIAKLDRPKKPKKPRAAVPFNDCALAQHCALRKDSKCTPIHCAFANTYVQNHPKKDQFPSVLISGSQTPNLKVL